MLQLGNANRVNHGNENCEEGSYLRLIDSCITQLKAQGPSRICNASKEEEKKKRLRPETKHRFFSIFFTPVTGPRRSSSLKPSDTRVYIRARLGTTTHFCEVIVFRLRWGGGIRSSADGAVAFEACCRHVPVQQPAHAGTFFFFFSLVTDPKRSLRLKLSDARVYELQIRGTRTHFREVIVFRLRGAGGYAVARIER